MTIFGVLVLMTSVLFIGGYIAFLLYAVAMWHADSKYIAYVILVLITVILLEWYIFTINTI